MYSLRKLNFCLINISLCIIVSVFGGKQLLLLSQIKRYMYKIGTFRIEIYQTYANLTDNVKN